MWTIILGALFKAVIAPVFGWLLSLHNQKMAQQLGATQVVAATDAQSAKVETAVAQAEAAAPKTQAQDVSAFEAGQV
jgi:hypothetical protein